MAASSRRKCLIHRKLLEQQMCQFEPPIPISSDQGTLVTAQCPTTSKEIFLGVMARQRIKTGFLKQGDGYAGMKDWLTYCQQCAHTHHEWVKGRSP